MHAGDTLSHYRVLALLGAGGMGEVYKAEDLRLKRAVAIKVLPAALVQDPEAKQRLVVEAQAASALDHPNICTIHEIDETLEGRTFVAMTYYEGETLKQRIGRGPLPIAEALDVIAQVARGAAAAHDAGIVHRDIKPANIFLCSRPTPRGHDESQAGVTAVVPIGDDAGRVKLLDFGIAKLSGQTGLTRTGTTVGTIGYMAPEHVGGQAIDERADVWSLGVVLYELLAGRLPFAAAHELALLRAIADEEPRPLRDVRPDVPAAVDSLVTKALQKHPTSRYCSARELLHDVEAARAAIQSTMSHAAPVPAAQRRGALVYIGAAAALVAVIGVWYASRQSRSADTRQIAADIRRLVDEERFSAALRRLHTIPPALAGNAEIVKLRNESFSPLTVRSDPTGAEVYFKGYDEPDAEWLLLGKTPIETRGAPGLYRWRATMAGYETFEGSTTAPAAVGELRLVLAKEGTTPEGMVRVQGGPIAAGARLPDFFIDRYEVTNRAFKRFVDADGYRKAEFWQQPFIKDGRTLPFEEAMAEFKDTTGRSGPATWELGTFPQGQDEWPVGGLSYYEAAAYARFAGKALPTVHHWRQAAAFGINSQILEWSNFSGKSPARVGEYKGIGAFGTYDMAGNVKEWCVNAIGDRRYILGGGWNEPNYQYRQSDARRPFDRSANNGMRLVIFPDAAAVPESARNPVAMQTRDYSTEKPVSDEVFAALARLYAYDATDLAARIESTDDESDDWRVERLSYNAAYGGERIGAYLFLPKNTAPPYQTVVYFPHSGGFALDSFHKAEMGYLAFLIKAKRALLFPMYKGLYERRLKAPPSGPNEARDMIIQQVKDVGRSVDYLQTRNDIDRQKVAFFGASLGSWMAPIILVTDKRFATAILWSGGLPMVRRPPEVDPINFAPRVTTPTLMLNGRDDFTFPVEQSQEPLFRLLGTPAADKRHGLYDGGHVFPFSRMIKDSLDWLDKYLGAPR